MECIEICFIYLMLFVFEKDIVSYFFVIKNYVLSNIMMDILIYIFENRLMFDYWLYFEYLYFIKFGK